MVIFLSTMKSFIYFSAVAIIIGGALAQQQQQYRGLQQQEDEPPVDVDSPWPTYSPTSAARADATGGPTSSAEATTAGGGAATTATDDASGGWGGSCPEELAGSMTLAVPFAQSPDGEGSTLTFKYAIVQSSSSDGRDVLCARLERVSDVVGGGYIGFGISPGGTMDGAVGIIGLPNGGTVMKYNLSGDRSVEVMTDDKQTLMSASIITQTEDGMTIMEFAKYLIEDGENEILANGANTFLYALGGDDGGNNDLAYHADRGSFVLDFETPAIIETEEAEGSEPVVADDTTDTSVENAGGDAVVCQASSSTPTCTSPTESIKCYPAYNTPELDGYSDEWETVKVYEAPLTGALCPSQYYPHGNGNVQIQCVYDAEKIHFLLHVPGPYRSSADENRKNAAMSMLFKMGEMATLPDMGGCPLADDCTTALEGGCDSYKVDMLHWELTATEMGDAYGPNESTGKDAVANKDDEYSVSLACRYDDDGADAGNEWEGSWSHSMPVEVSVEVERASTGSSENITMAEVRKHNLEEDLWFVVDDKVYDSTEYLPSHPGGPKYVIEQAGEESTKAFIAAHSLAAREQLEDLFIGYLDLDSLAEYVFEVSRPLQTPSTETDAQFEAGKAIDFGFAFWDPFESDEEGWSDAGYFLMGCSKAWISLELVEKIEETTVEETETSEETLEGTETIVNVGVEGKGTTSAAYFITKKAFSVSVVALTFVATMFI